MSEADIQGKVAERFAADVTEHQMTVLHDDGLYRHLRFQRPNTGDGWFDIVTWPGSLAIRGDMDAGYIFARVEDMFTFFRRNGNQRGINPGYWAEKIDGHARDTVKEHKKDLLRERLDQELSEYDKEYPARLAANEAAQKLYNNTAWEDGWPWDGAGPREPGTLHGPDVVRGLIEDYEADGLLDHRDGARDLLRELERIGFASDTWEWDLTDWSFHYLYACHSIVWAIAQYDAVKTVATKDGETHE